MGLGVNRRAILAAALAAAVVVSAVVAVAQQPSGAARTVMDSAGRQVLIPADVERVFVAGPPAAVAVYTLAPDKLLGWPHALSDAAKAVMPAKYAALPVLGRLTGPDTDAMIAEIAARHADLILDVGDVTQRYTALADRVQERTGVPYLLLDGHLSATAALYRTLGDVLGGPAQAVDLAKYAEMALADAERRVAGVTPDRRPRIFYVRDADGTQTAASDSITGELFELAGARNVAGRTHGPVTFEQVRDWDPDVIVTSNRDFVHTAFAEPRWQSLRAVRQHRVYRAPLAPFGWIDEPPAANRLIGLKWLLAVLYPPSSTQDLPSAVREFYQRFYHVILTDQQLADLLSSAP